MAKTTKKSDSVQDLLQAAGAVAKVVTKLDKPQAGLVWKLDGPKAKVFSDFVILNNIANDVEEHMKAEKSVVNEQFLKMWKDEVWKSKVIPEKSPKIESYNGQHIDCTAVFQIFTKKDSLKYDPFSDEHFDGDCVSTTINMLVEEGIPEEVAHNIVENEIVFIEHTYIPFDELVNGVYTKDGLVESSPQEKKVATKLLNFIISGKSEPLTDSEKTLVLKKRAEIQVKSGFLQRIFTYCESRNVFDSVLKVIRPIFFVSHMKFGLSDTDVEKQNRRMDFVDGFFGSPE